MTATFDPNRSILRVEWASATDQGDANDAPFSLETFVCVDDGEPFV